MQNNGSKSSQNKATQIISNERHRLPATLPNSKNKHGKETKERNIFQTGLTSNEVLMWSEERQAACDSSLHPSFMNPPFRSKSRTNGQQDEGKRLRETGCLPPHVMKREQRWQVPSVIISSGQPPIETQAACDSSKPQGHRRVK